MKIKKVITGFILAVLCGMLTFAFASCGANNNGKDPDTKSYQVTLHYNIGVSEDYGTYSVESGKTAASIVPNTMIKAGYTFDGWCTDEALTKDFDIENTAITSDITLYARWKKDKDREWFLSMLEEYEANATADSVAYTKVSFKAKVDGGDRKDMTADIVDGGITVGSYAVRLKITAEWFGNEFLSGEGKTLTKGTYRESSSGGIAATLHYTIGEENHTYSLTVDKYGYIVGCSERIENGEDELSTTLYLLSSIKYE